MQKYIDALKEMRTRCLMKKEEGRTASVALTTNAHYLAPRIESYTSLITFPSEQSALAKAASWKDAHVHTVITLANAPFMPNPIVIKLLADHARRTGTKMKYEVVDEEGNILYQLADVESTYYHPERVPIPFSGSPRPNYEMKTEDGQQLFEAAKKGMDAHFPSATKSTAYGAAVVAEDMVFFGGLYSSFDKQLSMHAEMVAVMCALAEGKTISELALVSTKFEKAVPHCCGACRQLLSEVAMRQDQDITIHTYSLSGEHFSASMKDYLPHTWDPRRQQ